MSRWQDCTLLPAPYEEWFLTKAEEIFHSDTYVDVTLDTEEWNRAEYLAQQLYNDAKKLQKNGNTTERKMNILSDYFSSVQCKAWNAFKVKPRFPDNVTN